nr:membrane dipeptidase [Acidaminobacter sp. JC074]
MSQIIGSIGSIERQFDHFDWLVKATKAEHIEEAKKKGLKAGIVSCQETLGLGKDLKLLDALYNYGLRVVQLTYNNQNYVASGCGEPDGSGVSVYGQKFIERLNELGIVVDTGHCNKQTTLDACKYSKTPVIASHTGVENVYHHMRCKSDEEIKAIAETGGVIGIFNMPWFIHEDPKNSTLEHFLDHVDYVVNLVGEDHVGIGTDWPMTDILPTLKIFKEKIAHTMGFKKGDGPSTEVIEGLETYGSFINITRGLVSRGYSEEAIKKIIGGNWMRVFKEVW